MTRLDVDLSGIAMRNPTMLASGMMGETGGSLLRVAESGAGALVTKSIGLEPREGHQNPSLVELDDGYINAMGLPGPGIDAFAEEMEVALRARVPIVGSLFASCADDFVTLAGVMEDNGASAVELNLSCPHAKGFGMEVGIDPAMVRSIVHDVKSSVSVPVLAKLTPNTHLIVDVGRAVEDGGGDAVVAINTLKAMHICPEAGRPVLSNRFGGLSGPATRPVGVRCVYELYDALSIPIVGVGGVETADDALQYIMAGATAVQVGSAIGRVGMDVFERITDGMEAFMGRKGYPDVESMVGVAHD